MILPDVLSAPRARALLDGIANGTPGAEMAERWLWLMHRRLLKVYRGIKPAGLGLGMMLMFQLQGAVMLEANILACAIHAAKSRRKELEAAA